jgi:hypothetical protein
MGAEAPYLICPPTLLVVISNPSAAKPPTRSVVVYLRHIYKDFRFVQVKGEIKILFLS